MEPDGPDRDATMVGGIQEDASASADSADATAHTRSETQRVDEEAANPEQPAVYSEGQEIVQDQESAYQPSQETEPPHLTTADLLSLVSWGDGSAPSLPSVASSETMMVSRVRRGN